MLSRTALALAMFALSACGKDECPDCEPEVLVEVCDDGIDNDDDGLVDCLDQDCSDVCDEDCGDGFDNDADSAIDCDDTDCDGECPEDCHDGRDNDGDGLVDCEDDECDGEGCSEVCDDGRDNDGDGLVDCEDVECAAGCAEDICDDGLDDDLDGLVDCDDDDCWGNGCEVTIATLTGVGMVGQVETLDAHLFAASYGSYTDVAYNVMYGSGELEGSAWGTVRYGTVSGAWDTCTWAVSSVQAQGSFVRAQFSAGGQGLGSNFRSELDLDRNGVQLSSACTLPRADFLPQRLVPGQAFAHSQGAWYAPAWTTSTSSFPYSSSSSWDSVTIDYFRGSAGMSSSGSPVGLASGVAVPYVRAWHP